MSVDQDVAKLRQLSQIVAEPLRSVLNEIIPLLPSVVLWIPVDTSGSAVCRYRPNNVRQYEVRYQIGDIGNLVHEMTHVAVNEAYGLDFVNYPNWHGLNVPARRLDAEGRCINEADRQTRQMSNAMNEQVGATLASLKGWAEASKELSDNQRMEVTNKLVYGMMNPQKESDTVMNQILVWLFEWGFPISGNHAQKPVVNAFHEELCKAVKSAYQARQDGKPMRFMRETALARRNAMGYGS
jgi:hypothetical protein